jgi:sulfonate transport system ATP-binding protein
MSIDNPDEPTRLEAVHGSRGGLNVQVSGLVKRFGERQVLHGLDLSIPAGEFVAIVGRSGCGKSTLLRQLAGLDTFCGGAISLDDQPRDSLGDQVRIMYQEARLLPWRTVIQNVALGLPGSGRRSERAPRRRWRRLALPTAPTSGRAVFPGASGNASRWRVR